jgi:hypothetical protein
MRLFALALAVFLALPSFAGQIHRGWYVFSSPAHDTNLPPEAGADLMTGDAEHPILIVRKVPAVDCPAGMRCNDSFSVPPSPFDLRMYPTLEAALPYYFIQRSRNRGVWIAVVAGGETAVISRE